MFDTYISEYDRSMSLLEESCRSNPAFASIVKKFEVKCPTERRRRWDCVFLPRVAFVSVFISFSQYKRIKYEQSARSELCRIPRDPPHGGSVLTVTYSNLGFSFHVCGGKVKPCGCFSQSRDQTWYFPWHSLSSSPFIFWSPCFRGG